MEQPLYTSSNTQSQTRPVYAFCLLVGSLILQLCLNDNTGYQLVPNFPLLALIYLMLSYRSQYGIASAFFLGIMLDLTQTTYLGFHALSLCGLATIFFLLAHKRTADSTASFVDALLLIIIHELLFQGLGIICFPIDSGKSIVLQSLLSILINTATWLILLFLSIIYHNINNR